MVDVEEEVDKAILAQRRWADLDNRMRDLIGSSQEYDKKILRYSIENQLRYRGNLVRFVKTDEYEYYRELLKYSRDHLMLFPYHLSDFIITGMRITPFQYYLSTMTQIIEQEKSYDTLPNFTAADCLRLLGIGRNQYIDIMNEFRSTNRGFLGLGMRRSARSLLPNKPHEKVPIEPWWFITAGYITEDDVRSMVTPSERSIIDRLVSPDGMSNQILACHLEESLVRSLYLKGLIYLDVPIYDDDHIVVPPLEGFVMNRVTGDYLENLLYKIFVSIDQNTPVSDLAHILEIDIRLVKNAVSMYCRLKFAYKKNIFIDQDKCHPSWQQKLDEYQYSTNIVSGPKKVVLFYDSNLAAFLMMGNLSPKLKNHAVTMFEVGKLSDEWIDSLLEELSNIEDDKLDHDGFEAKRYYIHALMLHKTIEFIRTGLNLNQIPESSCGNESKERIGLDLIRVESLSNLDLESCERFLKKNYQLIISVAPLNQGPNMRSAIGIPHLGAGSPLINSLWFRLFIYHVTECGPASLLLLQGYRLTQLPEPFSKAEILLINHWNRDPTCTSQHNALNAINEALTHSPVLVQVYPIPPIGGNLINSEEKVFVPLPLTSQELVQQVPAIKKLSECFDLTKTCGYITLLRAVIIEDIDLMLFDCQFGIPLFDTNLNHEVTNRISSEKLCEAGLDDLIENHSRLQLQVEKFVHEFSVSRGTNNCISGDQRHFFSFPDKLRCVIQRPAENLVFTGGKLSIFEK